MAHDGQYNPPAALALGGEAEARGEATIDMVELFYQTLANLKYVILVAIAAAFLGGAYATFMVTPQYTATAKLYISGQKGSVLALADLQIGDLLTKDYQEVFHTWEVHEMVRSELGLAYSYSQLQSMLSVTNPDNTRLLYINVTGHDPKEATEIANAYAASARRFVLETMDTEEPNLFSMALVPDSATGMGKTSYVLMGFILGTILALGLVLLRFVLDDRPRTPSDIAKFAGIPTLAVIPAASKRRAPSATPKSKGGNPSEPA